MDDFSVSRGPISHHVTNAAGRRISFQPEAVFQSVIQDGDTHELFIFLSNTDLFHVDIDQPNHTGITALHQSVLYNNLDMVKMLLTSGADVNLSDDNGLTPLHTASACGFLHVASMLLVFGADLFAQTKEGDLPVDFAKDLDMMVFLHQEMVSHLQRQHYFRSMIVHEGQKWLYLCVTGCMYYIKMFLDFIVTCLNDYYTKRTRRKNKEDANSLRRPSCGRSSNSEENCVFADDSQTQNDNTSASINEHQTSPNTIVHRKQE